MSSSRAPVKIRVSEYDRIQAAVFESDRRPIELIEGCLYEMPPIGTRHLLVVTRLQRLLEKALLDDFRVLVQQPLIVGKYSEPLPDVVLLREPLGRRKPRGADCLVVIEVSDSSYQEDRKIKVPLYMSGGVPLVWVVNVPARRLEEYVAAPGSAEPIARHYSPGGEIPSVAGIRVDLAMLLEDLPEDE